MTHRKQIVMPAPHQAELQETDFDDSPPGADEVIGRTLVSLISAGTEIAGLYTAKKNFPRFPGYAAVFEARQVGPDVKDIKPGQAVFCMGPHASAQRCRRSEALPVPAGLAPEQAVCARMASISMSTPNQTA